MPKLSRNLRSLARFAPALPLCLSLSLIARSALAEPNDGEASSLAKQAMETDYLGTQFDAAEQKLKKALDVCENGECSAKVEAQLHLDLGIVYIAGLKKPDKGRKEIQAAVAADGAVKLNPDFSTPEVEKAFEAAGGVPSDDEEEEEADAPKPAKAKSRPPKDDDEDEDEDEPKRSREKPAETDAPLNWISLAFQQDLLSFKDTTGVCTGAAQYQCFLQGKSVTDPIYRGAGNQLKGGVGFATRRVLIGYDRVLGENITLGAKLGFAFGGSPKATTGNGTAFLPLHAELRASYWFGKAPFASDGLRGYAGAAFGVGEVDAHVTVEYFAANDDGSNTGAKGKLDAWRKTGNTIAGLHGGLAYGFSKQHQLFLELRVLQMLGATAIGGAVNVGYAYGL
jgi:hypothetical protein